MKTDAMSVLENHQAFQKINLVRVLRQTVRAITHQISRELHQTGHQNLSARHLNVFENLETSGNNIVSLANRAGISKQAMSKLVKEVTAEGYISVATDKRDSRVQNVTLTEKGTDFLLALQKEALRNYYELLELGTVSKSDIKTVHQTLESIGGFLDTKARLFGHDFDN